METLTFEVPAMFGDHHVVEVRRLLYELEGVVDVYASSGFHIVEVTIDPVKVTADAIQEKLKASGYLQEMELPLESGKPATDEAERKIAFFRHTEAFQQVSHTVSFNQIVPEAKRPLWPCPGFGSVRTMDE